MPDNYERDREVCMVGSRKTLEAFRAWLSFSGVADRTVNEDANNLLLFAHYLATYEMKSLDRADGGDATMFMGYFLPRKQTSSVGRTKSHLKSLRKLFTFLTETGQLSPEAAQRAHKRLKSERKRYLELAAEHALW